jgi:voltage-gated potassium channel
MASDERQKQIPATAPLRQVRGRVPVARAWNSFVVHPSSVRKAIRVIIAAYISAMLIGGLTIWLLDPTDYPDPWKAFWYVLQTITTVGYGDATPTDPVGRLVGAGIMLIAIASLSILTAFITSAFVEARQADRRAENEAREVAHRQQLEAQLADLVERLERIERQGQARS